MEGFLASSLTEAAFHGITAASLAGVAVLLTHLFYRRTGPPYNATVLGSSLFLGFCAATFMAQSLATLLGFRGFAGVMAMLLAALSMALFVGFALATPRILRLPAPIDIARLYDELRVSVREKEVLLKEVHHRVKNNLQVISSLLSLQASYVDDPRAQQMLRDSQNRVRSIALFHEKLYQAHDLARVGMRAYLEGLCASLCQTYGDVCAHVRVEVTGEDLQLGVDTAIPCGLIVNELVTNALKHGFAGRRPGRVLVDMRRVDAGYTVSVEDDGTGVSPDVDLGGTGTLGMQLVHTLAEQLGGSVTVRRDLPGARFSVTFPG